MWPDTGSIKEAVITVARAKAESVLSRLPQKVEWILGVDTVVEFEGRIFGKPVDREQARQMLSDLSGRTHRVLSGLALLPRRDSEWVERSCISQVTFRSLAVEEIGAYLKTGEWHGAAGAYRIQETGAILVDSIKGSYSNIVGLPLSLFYGMLRSAGYPFQSGG